MSSDVEQDTDIDTSGFYVRRMLGLRLRNENIGKIPILLYWHPNIDECVSICGIPVDNCRGGCSDQTLFQKLKQSLWSKTSNILPLCSEPVFKVLTPSAQNLEYIFTNTRQKIIDRANEISQRVFNKSFSACWAEREKLLIEKFPSWDAHDRQMVLGFYIVKNADPVAINSGWRADRIDMQYVGDDGLLRLFISIEFRRAYRDKLIQQQRQLHCCMERQLRLQQTKQSSEQTNHVSEQPHKNDTTIAAVASVSADGAVSSSAATVVTAAVAVEEAKEKKEEKNWEYENSETDNSWFFQRAGNNVVSAGSQLITGTLATTQAIVYGTGKIVQNAVSKK